MTEPKMKELVDEYLEIRKKWLETAEAFVKPMVADVNKRTNQRELAVSSRYTGTDDELLLTVRRRSAGESATPEVVFKFTHKYEGNPFDFKTNYSLENNPHSVIAYSEGGREIGSFRSDDPIFGVSNERHTIARYIVALNL